uniref:BUB1 N-terminal domain-containing protein n=1 Tax=Strongyloides papillosus TaxID=174720 RepID=A0A0N5C1J9_STREA
MDSKSKIEEDWMLNRENIIPLKSGRSMKILNSVLSKSITIEEAEKKFEISFEESKSHEDPLSVIWEYIKWFENVFPTGKQKTLFPLLWKSVNYYSNFEELENDERLVKLWLKLCDNYPTRSLAILECAFTKGVGRYCASFYISWSEIYEAWGSETKAREILKMGLKYGGTPITSINRAIDNFEMRCIKRSLEKNNSCDDEDSDMDTDIQNEEYFEPEPIRRSVLGDLTMGVKRDVIKRKANPENNKENACNTTGKFNVYHDDRDFNDLDNDLEYQELFGYFEKVKSINSISIKENENRGSRKGGLPKLKEEKHNPVKEFEVFCDEDCDEGVVSKNSESKLTEQKAVKVISKRMCKKVFLKEGISVVERFVDNWNGIIIKSENGMHS